MLSFGLVGLKPGTEYKVTVIPMKDNTEGKPYSVSGRTGTWKVSFKTVMLLQRLGMDLSRSQHEKCIVGCFFMHDLQPGLV